ncbi:MAG: hypothetical protein KDB37_01500 [Ilumatobacter sp.]|nr:hypothetical protein [Ilumatobacter sp.]
MTRPTTLAIALGATVFGSFAAPGATVGAAPADEVTNEHGCGGIVFDDVDLDGALGELEPGVADVAIRVTDRVGRATDTTTDDDGVWHTDLDDDRFPVRLEFEVPAGYEHGTTGANNGSSVQFVDDPADCDGAPTGSFALFVPGASCAHTVSIVAGCYRSADHPELGASPAIELVDPATIDDGSVDGTDSADWLTLVPTERATVDQVGTIHALAGDWRGNLYAAAFVKRHTTLRSSLNPAGNPTTIYRLAPGAEPTVLVTLDPDATDPHDPDADPRDDPSVFGAVYRSGIGDIEVSPDGTRLVAVDLGRRELVTVALPSGDVVDRTALTAAALGIDGCAATETNPFGDLRPFGLGVTDDERLLVGVVCSAESTVPDDVVIDDDADGAAPLGDPSRLHGYVVEAGGDGFTVRLDWPLAVERGVTSDNGLLSNEATWHPWVDGVPFRDERAVVSYPQPAITDLVLDDAGNLIVALGDRWGHQTMPDSTAPTLTGDTYEIVESVVAGDLQRACANGDGWTIEGAGDCAGGWGNGFEWFDGDSYGWHAETSLGAVVNLPTEEGDIVVATQMDPLVGRPDPWRSGGLAWHDAANGDYVRGVRLFDGRNAEPDHTFEKSSGLAGLALLCETAQVEVGGRVWRDVDGDGDQDPAEPSIGGVVLELRSTDGVFLTETVTDRDGRYVFRDDGERPLVDGGAYLVTVAHRNATSGPFGRWGAHTGLRPSIPHADIDGAPDARLDSDAEVASADTPVSGMTVVSVFAGDDPTTPGLEPLVDHTIDLGFREQFDLAIATRWVRHDDVLGVLAFEVIVHNQGSEPSGPFELLDRLPYGTSLLAASHGAESGPAGTNTVTWRIDGDAELVPGETRRLTVIVHVDDATMSPYVNVVELTDYADRDDDSTPGNETLDSIRDRPNAYTADGGIIDDNGAWAEEDDADIATVDLHQVAGRVWVEPDRDGDYEPNDLVGDTEWERAVSGVAVVLRHVDGSEIERQWTSHDGTYRFTMVPSDEYVVEIQPDEFTDAHPLGPYRWVTSPYRTGSVDPLDGVTVPVDLRPGDEATMVIDLAFAPRPGRDWFGWYRTEFVLPILIALAIGLLLAQRRAHRLATVT